MDKLKDLISFKKTRLNELYEIFQYSIIYIIISFFWGFYLNSLFPEEDESKNPIRILSEIVLQCIAVAISVFYIRKLCQIVPLIINLKGFKEYKTDEYNGTVILSIVFMTTQKHIINKINILNNIYLL